jgi:hypothetical protein
MELVFVNYQLAWSEEWNTAVGRLSLSEGEGLFRATGKRVGFKPLTSILSPSHEGRGEKGHEAPAAERTRMSVPRPE